ncbi:MAG TPA: hypothetical protein VF389_11820 [Woeseiaceae bacterium]
MKAREALAQTREALETLDGDELGYCVVPPETDGSTGYEYPLRDELVTHINTAIVELDAALARARGEA